MKCRFCGCSETRACRFTLAGTPGIFSCSWLIENVCSAPACVDKAYIEASIVADQLEPLILPAPAETLLSIL